MNAFTPASNSGLLESLKFALEIVSKVTNPAFNSVRLERDGNDLRIIATDQYRALRVTIPGTWESGGPVGFTWPAANASGFVKWLTAVTATRVIESLEFDPPADTLKVNTLVSGSIVVTAENVGGYPPINRLMDNALNGDPVGTVAAVFGPVQQAALKSMTNMTGRTAKHRKAPTVTFHKESMTASFDLLGDSSLGRVEWLVSAALTPASS